MSKNILRDIKLKARDIDMKSPDDRKHRVKFVLRARADDKVQLEKRTDKQTTFEMTAAEDKTPSDTSSLPRATSSLPRDTSSLPPLSKSTEEELSTSADVVKQKTTAGKSTERDLGQDVPGSLYQTSNVDKTEAASDADLTSRKRKYLYSVPPEFLASWILNNKSSTFERGLLAETKLGCSYGYIKEGDVCFSFYDIVTTYANCKALCEIFRSLPVLPDSLDIYDTLYGLFRHSLESKNFDLRNSSFWVAIVNKQDHYWVSDFANNTKDTTSVKYARWADGQPGYVSTHGAKCSGISFVDAKYRTIRCDELNYCACSAPLMELNEHSPFG